VIIDMAWGLVLRFSAKLLPTSSNENGDFTFHKGTFPALSKHLGSIKFRNLIIAAAFKLVLKSSAW
jgi:hypothetical protein